MLSVDTEEEAVQTMEEVTEINLAGCFKMHAWTSNNRDLLNSSVNRVNDFKLIQFKSDDFGEEKTLGLCWNTPTETFIFKIELDKIPKEILSGNKRPCATSYV